MLPRGLSFSFNVFSSSLERAMTSVHLEKNSSNALLFTNNLLKRKAKYFICYLFMAMHILDRTVNLKETYFLKLIFGQIL